MPGSKPSEAGFAAVSTVDTAILRGLRFLARKQLADGSFMSFSSASMTPFRRVRSWQTVFVPALMLAALSNLEQSESMIVRDKLAAFLLSQKSKNWSFNYWAKAAPEYTKQPYPDDLDDTFCALAALCAHDAALVDAAALAKVVKLLIATEAAVGGPYRTWLASTDSDPVWHDVDVAVNSNIAYFLSLIDNRLPQLDSMIEQAITSKDFTSPYYPSPCVFIYYFARAYQGRRRDDLVAIAREMQAAAETELDTALCLSARLRLGDSAVAELTTGKLLAAQRSDGSWPAATFYADPVKNGKLYYNGAPALTTAIVLEALQLFWQTEKSVLAAAKPKAASKASARQISDVQTVLKLAEKQSLGLGDDLSASLRNSLHRMAADDNIQEIISLPDRFIRSLAPSLSPQATKLSAGLTRQLAAGNLFGWLAYTIYDDFLDDEGRPELIPVANAAMRRSVDNFSTALDDQSFTNFVRRIFDIIDSANAWEIANCRFAAEDRWLEVGRLPDYGNLDKLAERSLGHALAPMAVLAACGQAPDAAVSQKILKAFRHYLIARQLNDDAHDWADDLKNGHITAVVAQLLSETRIKPGRHDTAELLVSARQHFWQFTLPEICNWMQRHARAGRQALQRSGVLQEDNVVASLLTGIEASVQETLDQHGQAKQFLKHYKKTGQKGTRE